MKGPTATSQGVSPFSEIREDILDAAKTGMALVQKSGQAPLDRGCWTLGAYLIRISFLVKPALASPRPCCEQMKEFLLKENI
ncbi:MAG TPA: hypothetical protein VJ869_02970 [Sphaerochaeta sp.]|nr:hypothetical protein [Sphaerochaeta sp.]